MNFPRTTSRVINGLVAALKFWRETDALELIGANMRSYGAEPADWDSVVHWLTELEKYRSAPKRKQPIPPQLRKVLKAKYTR